MQLIKPEADDTAKKWHWPLSAQLCNWCAVAQVVATVVIWLVYGIGPQWPTPNESEIWHFKNVRTLLGPALLLESSQLISCWGSEKKLRVKAKGMSAMVILEYTVKMTYYTIMSFFDGGWVHVNLRAWGDPRPIYAPRWIGWGVAVPTLLAINNFPLVDGMSEAEFFWRMMPMMLDTWAYCLVCWMGSVTPDAWAGWFAIFISFVGWIFTIWDQLEFCMERHGRTNHFGFKLAIVLYIQIMFFNYGAIYLFGNFNFLTSWGCQVFFCYGDVFLKVSLASCLVVFRNWDDLMLILTLDTKVTQTTEDMSRFIRKASVPILSLDNWGRVTGWNEQIDYLTKISEEEAVGKVFADMLDPGCREVFRSAVQAARQGHTTGSVELMLTSKAGHTSQFLMNFIIQLGQTSGHILGVGQDVTELVNLKAVQERKSRFTAVVSHELRSPLHGITGLTAALADAVEDPGHKKQLNMIHGCARRLLDLVTNIMEMANIDKKVDAAMSGGLLVPDTPVNLMAVVEEVVWMTRMAVDKAGKPLISTKVQLVNNMSTGKVPAVLGDAYRCSQLFYNLITNACKFTDKGSVTVSARHDKANCILEVDVADTGKGIEPTALKRIFMPFEQENNKDTRSFQGIGLGLSVASGIAKLHGGEIVVQSKVGVGSTFTVRFPCKNDVMLGLTGPAVSTTTLSKPSLPAMGAVVPHPGVAGGKPGKVLQLGTPPGMKPLCLSVDDDEINQEVIEKTLGTTHRVVRAMNGQQALDILLKGGEMPSVVLLDVMMPGMTGFETVTKIRDELNIGHLPLPVIMLSAKSPMEKTAEEAFESGATDYMPKPFNSRLLQLRLRALGMLQSEAAAALKASAASAALNANAKAPLASGASPPGKAAQGAPPAQGSPSHSGPNTPRSGAPPAPGPAPPPPAATPAVDPSVLHAMTERAKKAEEELKKAQEKFRKQMEEHQHQASQAVTTARESAKKELAETREKMKQLEEQLKAAEAKNKELAEVELNDAASRNMGQDGRGFGGFGGYGDRYYGNGDGYGAYGGRRPRSLGSSSFRGVGGSPEMQRSGAGQDEGWYRQELEMKNETIAKLREQVTKWRMEAWMQRERADAAERELAFMRGGGPLPMGGPLMSMEPMGPMAMGRPMRMMQGYGGPLEDEY